MHAKDHHLTILAALVALEQTGVPDEHRTCPTMRDLHAHLRQVKEGQAQMNDREFETTMKNLRRRHTVRIVTKIKVDYCSKPVAVYGLQNVDVPKSLAKWQGAMSLFGGVVLSGGAAE